MQEGEQMTQAQMYGPDPETGEENVLGNPETDVDTIDWGIKHPDWEVMASTSVKDLATEGKVFVVLVKCLKSTKISEVQQRVAHRIETLKVGHIRASIALLTSQGQQTLFSESKVKSWFAHALSLSSLTLNDAARSSLQRWFPPKQTIGPKRQSQAQRWGTT